MAYLNATTDFVPFLPKSVPTFTGSSTPLTINAVATLIERVSVSVDGAAAGAGYGIPIPSTATQAWAQMQQITMHGVAWEVLRTIFPGQGGTGDRNSVADDYRIAYMDALKALRRGELPLIGAPSASGDGGRVLPRSAETGSLINADEGGASPIAQVGMTF